jgi:hypothetical protein
MPHIDPRALCAQTFAGRPAGLARLADRRTPGATKLLRTDKIML